MAKEDNTPMDDDAILEYVGRKIHDALNNEDGQISEARQSSHNAYTGQPYGNERAGYSKVVTREVAEVIEWAKPSVLRVFTGHDIVGEFEPTSLKDEEQADQETKAVNHHITRTNNWFKVFLDFLNDLMLYPNGYLKVWADESVVTEIESFADLTPNELADLENNEEYEILNQEQAEPKMTQQQDPQTGEIIEVPQEGLWSVDARWTSSNARIRVECVPPEQVLVDSDLSGLDMDEADFVCHRVPRTYSWLVRNGFDRDKLDDVGTEDGFRWGDEEINRRLLEDELGTDGDDDDPSMREFIVSECYCKLDVDGDGLAEDRQITVIGNKVFENEEYSGQPFIACSAIPMAHKHTGMSFASMMEDIQKIKTTLWRQLLDNIYRLNVRRKYMGEGAMLEDGSTMDAVMNVTTEIIPVLNVDQVKEEVVQPIVGEILPVIQGMADQQKTRSGVAPELSLDPSVLRDATEGAFNNAMDQASQRMEMLTRVIAECAIKPAFLKVHRLMRAHFDREVAFRVSGSWMESRPSLWRYRDTVHTKVGLGNNNQQRQMVIINELIKLQEKALQLGLADRQTIYNALEELVAAAGLHDATRYFLDPKDSPAPQQQQPDPSVLIQQELVKVEQSKVAQAGQKSQGELQLKAMAEQQDASEAQQKLENERRKLENERLKIEKESLDKMEQRRFDYIKLETDTQIKIAELQKPADGPSQESTALNGVLTAIVDGQNQMSRAMSAPKQVVRDEQGNVVGLQVVDG